MEHEFRWRQASGALAAAALVFTFACNGAPDAAGVSAQHLTADQAGAPVVVGCEPHQRTLVRQAVVNGAVVSQVECVAVAAAGTAPVHAPAYAPAAPARVVYAPGPAVQAARPVAEPVYGDVEDAQIVPVSSGAARPVRTNRVIYEERPVRKTRSPARSAVIIGSSAGAGAGVGAAVGGKKGALIGAAIGGGGAAIWDQVTRRR